MLRQAILPTLHECAQYKDTITLTATRCRAYRIEAGLLEKGVTAPGYGGMMSRPRSLPTFIRRAQE
jgi:hypothetical protein